MTTVSTAGTAYTPATQKITAALALMLLFVATTARADVSSAASSPSGTIVSVGSATTINLAWLVTTTAGGTVSSGEGTFRTKDGKVLGTVPQAISQSAGAAGTVTLMESVTVPAVVGVRANLTGEKEIYFERNFSDGGKTGTAALVLHVLTGSSGFRISNIALTFNNNAPTITVARSSKLTATGRVSFSTDYTGITTPANPIGDDGDAPAPYNLLVDASWEIAGPNPNPKDPQFRPLGPIKEYLSGNGQLVSTTPALPTKDPGLYLLRMEFTTPAVLFEEPAVRYIVK